VVHRDSKAADWSRPPPVGASSALIMTIGLDEAGRPIRRRQRGAGRSPLLVRCDVVVATRT
jgi:hypothetical protein